MAIVKYPNQKPKNRTTAIHARNFRFTDEDMQIFSHIQKITGFKKIKIIRQAIRAYYTDIKIRTFD